MFNNLVYFYNLKLGLTTYVLPPIADIPPTLAEDIFQLASNRSIQHTFCWCWWLVAYLVGSLAAISCCDSRRLTAIPLHYHSD